MIAAVAKTQKERDHALEILKLREKRKKEKEQQEQSHFDADNIATEDEQGNVVKFRKLSSKSESKEVYPLAESDEQEIISKSWGFFFLIFYMKFIYICLGETIISVLRFIWKISLAVLDYMATFLNRRSREQYVFNFLLTILLTC